LPDLADDADAQAPPPENEPASEKKLPDVGDYELLELIGRGGMGVVYRARQRSLHRIVALKTLSGGVHASEDFKRRFWREARMAAKLQHPNIVPVFEIGEDDGQPFFSMEYVSGTDLKQMTREAPLPPEQAARYVEAAARAVHHAHEQGVLHRDLKPSNILIGADDRPRITDFGLARPLMAASSLTMSGAVLGTPGYLPPEQLSAGRGTAGPSSDVYGLGAVLYHLLTGRPPFMGSTLADTLKQSLECQPVPPRKLNLAVPPDLEFICLKCLKKNQKERYQSALALAEDLERYLNGQATLGRWQGLAGSEQDWPEEPPRKESNAGAWIMLLLLAALATCAAAWWKDWGQLRTRVLGSPGVKQIELSTSQAGGNGEVPEVEQTRLPAPDAATISLPNHARTQPAPQGTLTVRFLPDSLYENEWARCEITGQGPSTNLDRILIGRTFEVQLPAGAYRVNLAHVDKDNRVWRLESPVQIESNRSESVSFRFAYAALTVESDPAGADVTWPKEFSIGDETSGTAPFSKRFRSGAIPFTARLHGYADCRITNYFYPVVDDPAKNRFAIPLQARSVPLGGRSFTNSLGMIFRWVVPLQMWACEWETRVGDFRAFASDGAARGNPSPAMQSVTSNGWRASGFSWDNPAPGFCRGDNCPVVGVNWQDAANFCEWLTHRERRLGRLLAKQVYRLPTVKEWRALAGGSAFPQGAEPTGNYSGVEVLGSDWPQCWPVLTNHDDGFARTAPVDAPNFANSLGYYHVGGNAAEWCADGALCGGSWFDGEIDDLSHLRTESAVETPENRDECQDRNGFRVFLEDPWLLQDTPK